MKTIIEKVEAAGDFVTGEDGFIGYWPTGSGMLSAENLHVLADELDRRNAPLHKSIEDYFNENPCLDTGEEADDEDFESV